MVRTEIKHLREARDHWEMGASKATKRCETLEKEIHSLSRVNRMNQQKLAALDKRERLE